MVLLAVAIAKGAARAAAAALAKVGGVALPQERGPVVRAPVALGQRERLEGDARASCSALRGYVRAIDAFGGVGSRIPIVLVSLAYAAIEARSADVDGRRASRALLATCAFRLRAVRADGARDGSITSGNGVESLCCGLTLGLGSDASDVAVSAWKETCREGSVDLWR